MSEGYIPLKDITCYQISYELCNISWDIYESFSWQEKKVLGDQFIRSIDSIGANIAEGYGRYHYLDRIKFYYNARGSLLESKHWVVLLKQRKKISKEMYDNMIDKLNELHKQLNVFIKSVYPKK